MKEELSVSVIERYLKDECTDVEIEEVNAWYSSFEFKKDDISGLAADKKEMLRLLMLNNIKENIRNAEGSDSVYALQNRFGNIRSVIYKLVGIAAVLCIVFFVVQHKNNTSQLQTNEEIVVNNMTNVIQKIILSDGSRVWLNPKTRLSYLKVFGNHSRSVMMDGEAFFEVTKNPKKPFSIYSGNVVTKVWGTSFRIQSNRNGITKVDVVTGKVSVGIIGSNYPTDKLNNTGAVALKQQVMLLPNQEASYNKKSDNLIKNTTIDDPTISIWKKTSLSFDNTPMLQVFQVLGKKFNVHIWSDDKTVNTDNLKADFTNESFPAILEMMSKTLNVNYSVDGNDFVLKSN